MKVIRNTLILLVFIFIVLLVFVGIRGNLESCLQGFNISSLDSWHFEKCLNKQEKKFNVDSVSDKKQFIGPFSDVLGVTFQYVYQLTPQAHFSEFGLSDAIVVNVPDRDKSFIVVSKNGKKLSFPIIGVVGFRSSAESSYEPVLVRLLSNRIVVGDKIDLHATYVSPFSSLSTTQIQKKLLENVEDGPFRKEAELQIKLRENAGFTESQALELIYNNTNISFQPRQLIVTSLESK